MRLRVGGINQNILGCILGNPMYGNHHKLHSLGFRIKGLRFGVTSGLIVGALLGLYRAYIGVMENKMETTTMGLYRVEGLGFRVYSAPQCPCHVL